MNTKTLKKHFVKTVKPNRDESHNPEVILLTHEHKGRIWQAFADKHIPRKLYKKFGLLDTKGSEEWLNVVEHHVFVAGAAMTLGKHVRQGRTKISTERLIKAAIVHDLTKRFDVEHDVTRESEAHNSLKAHELLNAGYDYMTMQAAFNTGRVVDRYITNASIRSQSISNRSLEANIIGYVDARTRGSQIFSLKQAYRDNIANKHRAADRKFFTKYWLPYFTAVEKHLKNQLEDFDPSELNDTTVYRAVLHAVQAQDYK